MKIDGLRFDPGPECELCDDLGLVAGEPGRLTYCTCRFGEFHRRNAELTAPAPPAWWPT